MLTGESTEFYCGAIHLHLQFQPPNLQVKIITGVEGVGQDGMQEWTVFRIF